MGNLDPIRHATWCDGDAIGSSTIDKVMYGVMHLNDVPRPRPNYLLVCIMVRVQDDNVPHT